MIAEAMWFSVMNLKSACSEIVLSLTLKGKQRSQLDTACASPLSTTIYFGLCNAPATLERLTESVLGRSKFRWLDIPGRVRRPAKGLSEFPKGTHLTINEKCKLLLKELWFLGHFTLMQGVTTDQKKLMAVSQCPLPKDKHELRSFLGLYTYCQSP
jgi:hypothetical protein